jgi:DNA-binding response OmpR family regulator
MGALKILIADDDSLNLMIIERHLVNGLKKYDTIDFEVLTANNGVEALELAKNNLFDLILLDWEMPEMDGIDVLKLLKSDELTQEVPIIMVTSNTSSEHLKTAIEAGAIDFLKKPIDPLELIARVRSVIKVSTAYQQIKKQHLEISLQKEQITASINYALRMQKAMIPSNELLHRMSSDYFVLNIPKDIVSGDFYWASIESGLNFYIVADCTGHGVPGAMMSMIGNNLLNEIIKNKKIYSPEIILVHLHRGIRMAFNQSKSESRDGMDISIVVWDKNKKILSFAGAMNNMILITNNESIDILADKYSIGGKQLEEERIFTKQEIQISDPENTHFYIYSDGYHDQFGGVDFKKFYLKRFKELLIENNKLPKSELKALLKTTFDNWISGYSQMDDILVMGVQL